MPALFGILRIWRRDKDLYIFRSQEAAIRSYDKQLQRTVSKDVIRNGQRADQLFVVLICHLIKSIPFNMKYLSLLLASLLMFSLPSIAQDTPPESEKIKVNEDRTASDKEPTIIIEAEDTYLVLEGPQALSNARILEPDWIESVNVFKGQANYPEAYRAHAGAHGLVVIALKEPYRKDLPESLLEQAKVMESPEDNESIMGKTAPDNLQLNTSTDNPPTFVIELNDSYAVLGDTESSNVSALNPDWIKSLMVYKSQDTYPAPYQELGEHGLIVIQLKEQHVKDLPQAIKDRVVE